MFPRQIDITNKELDLTYQESLPQVRDKHHQQPGEGELDFDRWASLDPNCWRAPRISSNSKTAFKAHIICDPVGTYPADYWRFFYEKHRCDIYVLIGSRLKKINSEIDLDIYRKYATPYSDNKEVRKIAVRYRLTPEKITILNYGRRVALFNKLFFHKEYPEINLSDFNNCDEERFQNLIKSISKEMLLNVRIELDKSYPLIKMFFNIIKSSCQIQEYTLDKQHDYAQIDINDTLKFTAKDMGKIKHYMASISLTDIQTLTHLIKHNVKLRSAGYHHRNYSKEDFIKLKTSLLKTLVDYDTTLRESTLNDDQLESFKITHPQKSNYPASHLIKELDRLPKLNKIMINGNIINDLDEKATAASDKKWELTLLDSTFDVTFLIILIKKFRNLTLLQLKNCHITNSNKVKLSEFDELTLPSLKCLDVNSFTGDREDVSSLIDKLLKISPELEVVKLCKAPIYLDKHSFVVCLTQLRILEIRALTTKEMICGDYILRLIKNSKNLESLCIDQSNELRNADVVKEIITATFPKLEKLELIGIGADLFDQLVPKSISNTESSATAPRLKELILTDVYLGKLGPASPLFYVLPELQTIIIQKGHMHGNLTNALLQSSNKLHTVSLNQHNTYLTLNGKFSCQSLSIDNAVAIDDSFDINLQGQLQSLHLDRIDCRRILAYAHKIQRLSISLNENMRLPYNMSFPELTELVIECLNNGEATDIVQKLIAKSPKLRKLDITVLKNKSSETKPSFDLLGMKQKTYLELKHPLDLSQLEDLTLTRVKIISEEKCVDLRHLKRLSMTDCYVSGLGYTTTMLDTLFELEILEISGDELFLYASSHIEHILNNCKKIQYLIIKSDSFHQNTFNTLYQALAGRHFKLLQIFGLSIKQAELLASEFPYGDFHITLKYMLIDEPAVIEEPKILNTRHNPTVELDGEVAQTTVYSHHLDRYIWPSSLDISEYREHVYPRLVLKRGNLAWEESKHPPVVCANQPKRTTKLYQQFCQLKDKKQEYYYIEKTFKFRSNLARLTGVSSADEIISYESAEKITFLEVDETNQYYASSRKKSVLIAYLIKPKIIYYRNTLNKSTIDTIEAQKLVADFHFSYDQRKERITIIRGPECNKVDNYTLFKAAVALTTDEEIWCDKKLDFTSLKGIPLLEAIRKNTTGRCRQQATFIKALANALEITCSIITSQTHAFVQFYLIIDGITHHYSERIGGYFSITHIAENAPGRFFDNESTEKNELPEVEVKQLGLPTEEPMHPKALPAPAANEEKKEHKIALNPTIIADEKAEHKTIASPYVKAEFKKPFSQFYHELMAQLDQQLSENDKTGLLYVADNKSALRTCAAQLMEATTKLGHRSYFINDLAEITTESLMINKNGKAVAVGSDFKQFMEQARPGDLLIIRCPKRFSIRALLYSALDKSRHINNIKIPLGIKIIGLLKKKNIITERAFQRRFKVKVDLVEQGVELSNDYLTKHQRYLTERPSEEKSIISKDFCDGDIFKQDFSGRPVFTATGSRFEPGLVTTMMESERKRPVVELINAGNGREQELILLNMLATEAAFVNGEWRYQLPDFRLLLTNYEYDFSKRCTYEPLTAKNINECVYILNPKIYPKFLRHYGCDRTTKRLLTPDGLLAIKHEKALTIRVTKKLKSSGQGKRFFDEADKHGVKLRLILDHGVAFDGVEPFEDEPIVSHPSSLSIYLNKDPYNAVAAFEHEIKPSLTVYVGRKHHYHHLIQSIQPIELKDSHFTGYELVIGEIANLLVEGQNDVLLVGDISESLAQNLETLCANPPYLFINDAPVLVKGRLHILTSNDKLLHSAYHEMKLTAEIEQSLAPKIKESKIAIDDKNDEQEIRLKRVCAKLESSPGVYLEGPTAAGKSTAIRRHLSKYYGKPITIYEGLKSLNQFVHFDKNDITDHILFSDECELQEDGAYDEFEGTYKPKNPKLLAMLKAIDWKPNMKFIAAGNGKSVQGRVKHDFFERHKDMRVDFPPLSLSYTKEYILKKLLSALLPHLSLHYDTIINIFYAASRFIDEPQVVTIRNWSQMCLQLALRPDGNIEQAAKLAAYDELSGMLHDDNLTSFQISMFGSSLACNKLLTAINNKAAAELNIKLAALDRKRQLDPNYDAVNKFILTPSRHYAARMIMDALSIRDMRKKLVSSYPDIRYHGIFSILLSGDSELGKSFMVTEILQAMGFQDGQTAVAGSQKYCSLSAFNQKESKKAFDEGWIVVRDEYNSTFNEDQDNDFLSNVDINGKDAKEMGWFMFATENTADHEQRIAPSPAAANRRKNMTLNPFTMEEYHLMLVGWGLSSQHAQRLLATKDQWDLSDLQDAARRSLSQHSKNKNILIAQNNFSWKRFIGTTILDGIFVAGSIALTLFFPQLLALKILTLIITLTAISRLALRMGEACIIKKGQQSNKIATPTSSYVTAMSPHLKLHSNAHSYNRSNTRELESNISHNTVKHQYQQLAIQRSPSRRF